MSVMLLVVLPAVDPRTAVVLSAADERVERCVPAGGPSVVLGARLEEFGSNG